VAMRKMRMICAAGDKVLAEWDRATTTPERLMEIEREFDVRIREGWFAADIRCQRDVLIRKFDPDAEILLIPRVQGGA